MVCQLYLLKKNPDFYPLPLSSPDLKNKQTIQLQYLITSPDGDVNQVLSSVGRSATSEAQAMPDGVASFSTRNLYQVVYFFLKLKRALLIVSKVPDGIGATAIRCQYGVVGR